MSKFLSIDIPAKRVFGLDLLRFFAIIFVLINHGGYQLPKSIQHYNQYLYMDGVLLFFVLSGFLIGGIFIKFYNKQNLSKNIFNFWIRRWMRTIPAYFFVLTIVCILHFFFFNELKMLETFKHYVFIQNFLHFSGYLFPEAWSLSIEEWFYLLLPIATIISFTFFSNKKIAFLLVILSFIFIMPMFRFYFWSQYKIGNDIAEWDRVFRSVTVLRLDSIMFGVFGAYLKHYSPNIFFKSKNIKFFMGLILLITLRLIDLQGDYSTIFQCVFSFTINSFAVFLMLPFFLLLKEPKNKTFVNLIVFTSLVSYSLYLVNSTLLQSLFLNRITSIEAFPIKYCLYWGLTFFFATLIYKYVELPFMKVRDKYFSH